MLKRILIPVAGAFALAIYAFAPQPASAASLGSGAAAAQAAEADLSNVVDVHRRYYRRYAWGAPFAVAPYAYYGAYGGPSWHYRYFGPHKRRCGYTYWGYTCW
ncbi:MAG TPA: hypothetical protein VH765_07655 [Xanthobacteraceae bacterium]|jgi:hypothetical protein